MSDQQVIPVSDQTVRKHAVYPPSASARWMVCSASPYMSEKYGVYGPASQYADEGTKAHEVAEACAIRLLRDREPIEVIVSQIEDTELAECMKPYLEEIESTYFEEPESWTVEGKVNLSPVYGLENQYGYVDCMLASGDELHVFDYKHGVGIPVQAEQNTQIMIYAWAALQKPEAKNLTTVTLHIIQPRLPYGPTTNSWTVSREDLRKFGTDLYLYVQKANKILESGNPTDEDFAPGVDTCRFCPAKGSCDAFSNMTSPQLGLPKTLPSPVKATEQELGAVLKFKDLVVDWFKQVEDETFRRITSGKAVPGFKVVKGNQGIRRWRDKKEAEEVLRSMRIPVDYAYKQEIISPTRAEELNKKVKKDNGKPIIGDRQWATLKELVVRNEGKPQLVDESDKREAMTFDVVDDADLEEIADGPAADVQKAPELPV